MKNLSEKTVSELACALEYSGRLQHYNGAGLVVAKVAGFQRYEVSETYLPRSERTKLFSDAEKAIRFYLLT